MPLALRKIVEQRGLPLTPKVEDAIDAAVAEGVRPSTFGHAIDDAQTRHGVKDLAAYAIKTARQWHREGSEPPTTFAVNGNSRSTRREHDSAFIAAVTGRTSSGVDAGEFIDVEASEVRYVADQRRP
ncbi:hypothetical protein CR51_27340 [Caballeronia megalochromosomata]|nr:hypothetical protein CR51_27340 [Caballeronia megalochromosomata]